MELIKTNYFLILQNLSAIRVMLFSATPAIPNDILIAGTQTDGVIKLDYSKIPQGYAVVGHDCYSDTPEIDNFAYGSITDGGNFRFRRSQSTKGFYVFAYAIRL